MSEKALVGAIQESHFCASLCRAVLYEMAASEPLPTTHAHVVSTSFILSLIVALTKAAVRFYSLGYCLKKVHTIETERTVEQRSAFTRHGSG